MSKRILAFSSSRSGNSGYLETAVPIIKKFLGDKPLQIAFIPFASVQTNYEEYAGAVRSALKNLFYKIKVVEGLEAKKIINESDAIMVGGGNTFKLLHDIYENNLLDIIRDKVSRGTPYIGWSAGSNILCPGIATTNDMPIIQPKSFNALGLLPFQINPHYTNKKPEAHHGETRDHRLDEFVLMNPGISVAGLPEGSALHLENLVLKFIGSTPGMMIDATDSNLKKNIVDGEDLSFLL